jgi:3-phosphoshikimate 1-carboxyvinyltransferase
MWHVELTLASAPRTIAAEESMAGDDGLIVMAPHARGGVGGTIDAPPSKSLTQRAMVVAALAGDGSRVCRPLDADDPRLLFEALRMAGFPLVWEEDITAAGARTPVEGGRAFLGNNGTGARFLLAQLAALPGRWTIDGSQRLRTRPLAPLVEALRGLGADISRASSSDAELPLEVRGRELAGGEVVADAAASSQFVSALLLLGARLPRGLVVRLPAPPPSRPYVNLTIDVLRAVGVGVETDQTGTLFSVTSGGLRPATLRVEGDWSAAAFPLCAAAVAGGRVEVCGVRRDSRQGDAIVASLLEQAGCEVEATEEGVALRGPALIPIVADLSDTPDLFLPLAVVTARVGGRLSGLGTLAVKESDRVAVMTDRLRRIGFTVERGPTWFGAPAAHLTPQVGPEPLDPAGDHRIAMGLAVAGTVVPGVRIADAGCVAKSWPEFWSAWRAVAGARS